MSKFYNNIERLLKSGLISKDETILRQELLSLYDSLQTELKSYSSPEYQSVVEFLSKKIPELYSSTSIACNRRALFATICVICCGGILFNDMKARLREQLCKILFESTSDDLSDLIALTVAHFEATQSPAHAYRFDNIIQGIVEKLSSDQTDARRLICLNTLAEVARRCPNHIFPSIKECVEILIKHLFSSKIKIRSAAALALRLILWVINYRETITEKTNKYNVLDNYTPVLEKISREEILLLFKASKQFVRDDTVHGRLLLLYELFRASVISQSPQCATTEDSATNVLMSSNNDASFAMIEYNRTNRSHMGDIHSRSYTELHATRLRRISGSLLSQPTSPVTMLEPRNEPFFNAPFSITNHLVSIRSDLWISLCTMLKSTLRSAFKATNTQPHINVALDLLPWVAALHSRTDPLITGSSFEQLVELLFIGCKKDKYTCKCLSTLACLFSVLPTVMQKYVDPMFELIRADLLVKGIALNEKRHKSNRKYPPDSIQAAICFTFVVFARTYRDTYADKLSNYFELLIKSGLSNVSSHCTLSIIKYIPSVKKHYLTVLYNYLSSYMIQISNLIDPHYVDYGFPENSASSQIELRNISDASTSAASNTSPSNLSKVALHFYSFGTMYYSPLGSLNTPVKSQILDLGRYFLLNALISKAFRESVKYNMVPILNTINSRLLHANDKFVRMQSIRACCRLLIPLVKNQRKHPSFSHNESYVISDYLQSIIKLGVSDAEADVRYFAISSLDDNPKFNYYIAKPENLNILFLASNDEVSEVREVTISLLGQLSNINPSYVLASLRKILFELLHELHVGELYFSREQTLRSIGNLISSAPRLMCPYIHPILRIIIRTIEENFDSPILVPAVHVVGEYAQVSHGDLKIHVEALFFPVLLKMLGSENSTERKEVALWTMTRVIQSSSYIGKLGNRYVILFEILSNLIRSESSKFIHREALRVLGVLGALSPYKYKLYTGEINNRIDAFSSSNISNNDIDNDNNIDSTPSTYTHDEEARTNAILGIHSPGNFRIRRSGESLYAAHVISELLNVLRNPQLKYVHVQATEALSTILCSLSSDVSQFVYLCVIQILEIITTANEDNMDNFIQELILILTKKKREVKPCLGKIFEIICDILKRDWTGSPRILNSILSWVECLAKIFTSDFRLYAIRLLPILRNILNVKAASNTTSNQSVYSVLDLFSRLGYLFEQHMNVVIPSIVEVAVNSKIDLDVRRRAIESLTKINESVNLSEFASGILLPLLRSCATLTELKECTRDCILSIARIMGNNILIFKHQLDKVYKDDVLVKDTIDAAQTYQENTFPMLNFDARKSLNSLEHVEDNDFEIFYEDYGEAMKPLNEARLKTLREIWNPSKRMVKEDVRDWFRTFTVVLLAESTSPSLKACYSKLFDAYPDISMKLFNVSFMCCWTVLDCHDRSDIRECLSQVLKHCESTEVAYHILELVEFFDHSDLSRKIVRFDKLDDVNRVSYRILKHKCQPVSRSSRSPKSERVSILRAKYDPTMEYRESLPVDLNILSSKAIELKMFAKALHYTEVRFAGKQSEEVVEDLISINNQLDQSEAAYGAVGYARDQNMSIKELWYEKLNEWDRALRRYEYRQANEPGDEQLILGRMRCLHALGEWNQLEEMCEEKLRSDKQLSSSTLQSIAELGASCCWRLESWNHIVTFVDMLPTSTVNACLYRAIILMKKTKYREAYSVINEAWTLLHQRFLSVASEDYRRNYEVIFDAQMLVELEEVIQYSLMSDSQITIKTLWKRRITECCMADYDDWHRLLLIHSLVLSPSEDQNLWLKLANICTKANKKQQASYIFTRLLGHNPRSFADVPLHKPFAAFAFLDNAWHTDGITKTQRESLLIELSRLINSLSINNVHGSAQNIQNISNLQYAYDGKSSQDINITKQKLFSECCHQYGSWYIDIHGLSEDTIALAKRYFDAAINHDRWSYAAYSAIATFNYNIVLHYKQPYSRQDSTTSSGTAINEIADVKVLDYVVEAMNSFFVSVCLSRENRLQNLLRLLTLWFKFGMSTVIYNVVNERVKTVPTVAWLQVIPQLIARIDSSKIMVARLVQQLLIDVGRNHPQALIYPLTVTAKSHVLSRNEAAAKVLNSMREHSNKLVGQALLVSQELIRISIIWQEQWHEALDEASRLYFNHNDVQGFFELLEPLHEMISHKAQSIKERVFVDMYGSDLIQAKEHCERYRANRDRRELTQAWNFYYQVFQRLTNQIKDISTLDLKYVSPKLVECRELELAVPGTYNPVACITEGEFRSTDTSSCNTYYSKLMVRSHEDSCELDDNHIVYIQRFDPHITIIPSKQRPRKLRIYGSNGQIYQFLLKGHEDIRQDQRVMQLFDLVNNILLSSEDQHIHDLSICRYSTIPLSTNHGLIGWVSHCDTIHSLVKEYRTSNRIPINVEHKLIEALCPDYDSLPLINKVEVFEQTLLRSNADDLACILWQKSSTAENWCSRRSNFTRSLAVMSMVGYILGLGDRHPSNIMINRASGKVVHIDFGDCFEVAINREKFPETIPFRLTRMLIGAMEVTGISGTFKITCETVMRVLRMHRDNLLAVLEAFVYDPVISWRLITAVEHYPSETRDDFVINKTVNGTSKLIAANEFEKEILAQTRLQRATTIDPEQRTDAEKEHVLMQIFPSMFYLNFLILNVPCVSIQYYPYTTSN